MHVHHVQNTFLDSVYFCMCIVWHSVLSNLYVIIYRYNFIYAF